MGEKVTLMILKVDLQCTSCYKKVKKILCKFPQIRDQVYDEKNNLVKITVVCCNPEKIRDKLCSKAGCDKVIKSIEIVEPKPPPKEKPPPPKKPAAKPKESPKPDPKPAPKVPEPDPIPVMPPPVEKPPIAAYPVPVGFCCGQCYEGYGGGPCFHGYGRPVPAPPCFHGYGPPVPAPPCYDGYGYSYWRTSYVSRCDYFSEENTAACTIM